METITFQNENEIRVIHVDKLLAVIVADYLCTFFVENEKSFSCTKSLKEVASELPDFFIRINRNCIVNKNKISDIDLKHRKVEMLSGKTFAFSVRNAHPLKKAIFPEHYAKLSHK